jgi:Fe-S-cluster containining protein
MGNDVRIWEIVWELPRREFLVDIREKIERATEEKLVLPLPVTILPGGLFESVMSLLLPQVNCSGCNAPCCRRNISGLPFAIHLEECEALSKKYGADKFTIVGGYAHLPMPCPFLESNQCSIYEDRPLVCIMYPFQPGASAPSGVDLLALESSCPEARRITMKVYMAYWEILQKVELIHPARKAKIGGKK